MRAAVCSENTLKSSSESSPIRRIFTNCMTCPTLFTKRPRISSRSFCRASVSCSLSTSARSTLTPQVRLLQARIGDFSFRGDRLTFGLGFASLPPPCCPPYGSPYATLRVILRLERSKSLVFTEVLTTLRVQQGGKGW
jgi:hypothetical protein